MNKNTYKISIPETHLAIWNIDADTEEEAIKKVRKSYKEEEGPDEVEYLTTNMNVQIHKR